MPRPAISAFVLLAACAQVHEPAPAPSPSRAPDGDIAAFRLERVP